MRPPSLLSIALVLVAAALLLATRTASTTSMSTAFLDPLARAVADHDDETAGNLFWTNFDELVYLTRKGDPTALQITQRVLLREAPPGGCSCCSGGFRDAIFADGALPAKTKQLIAVAVAHVTQCPYCIRGHTDAALHQGASAEEIMEAIWVAAEMRAGGAYAHSVLALDTIAHSSAQKGNHAA